MKALLITYLWITGIGAAIVLAVPGLVVIGLFLLIVPGLILGLLPTAFLYGVVFALVWFPLHLVAGDWPAAIAAALVTLGIMFAVPIEGNRVTEARYRAELADDSLPAVPIVLAGHVRVDRLTALSRKDVDSVIAYRARSGGKLDAGDLARMDRDCTDLCTALLFTAGVESVTVNTDNSGTGDLAPGAATFRLVPRSECETTLVPRGQNDGMFIGWPDGVRDLQDYWKLRLSTDRCLVRVPTRTVHDLRIVGSDRLLPLETAGGIMKSAPFGPRSVRVHRLEIFDAAGQRLLRQTLASAKRITRPIVYAPGGTMSNFHFDWNMAEIGPRYPEPLKAIPLLVAHAGLNVAVDKAVLVAGIRAQLAAVVADPGRTIEKPMVDMVPAFFGAMEKTVVAPADIDLALRLIGDRRFTKFDGLWALRLAMPDDVARLRGAIVDRLLVTDPAKDRSLKQLGDQLAELPPGSFAELAPNEATLLADVERRTLAAGLIRRQADRSGAAAPLLATIIGEQLAAQAAEPRSKKSWEVVEHHTAFHAAMDALTRIGPAAGAALAPLEDLAARGGVFDGLRDSENWNVMLVRLGKPVADLRKPERTKGTDAEYRVRIRTAAERVERDIANEARRRQQR